MVLPLIVAADAFSLSLARCIIDELGFVPLSKTGAELLFELVAAL